MTKKKQNPDGPSVAPAHQPLPSHPVDPLHPAPDHPPGDAMPTFPEGEDPAKAPPTFQPEPDVKSEPT